ncbi:MAG TPA: hypothetical protein VIC25_09370 [Caulobacteraceae bacterium]
MRMRHLMLAGVSAALLAGCAGSYGMDYGYGGGFYGPVADTYYDGYYDGYYGPIYDGYWGDNGAFFYRSSDHDRWRRADNAHVRRDAAPGFNHIRGTARAAPQRTRRQDHPGR